MDERRRRWRRRRWVLLALTVVLVSGVYTFRRPLFRKNFGVVVPGQVYRSAQPLSGLGATVRDYKLASILNLRGGSPSDPFYADEVRLATGQGVDFYDFPMSATRRPTRRELLTLLDLFGRCRYPLLIHCKSGSDRTALASALYLMAVRGVGPERAMRAFALSYGHVALNGTQLLHEPFLEYGQWLTSHRLPHTPERLREWVEHVYPGPGPGSSPPFQPLRPGPRTAYQGAGAARR